MEQITAPVLESAPSLKVISRNVVGTDAIDMAAASRLGITVLNAPGANAQSVAELSLTLALNALRNVPWSSAALVRGEWCRLEGRELGSARWVLLVSAPSADGRPPPSVPLVQQSSVATQHPLR